MGAIMTHFDALQFEFVVELLALFVCESRRDVGENVSEQELASDHDTDGSQHLGRVRRVNVAISGRRERGDDVVHTRDVEPRWRLVRPVLSKDNNIQCHVI